MVDLTSLLAWQAPPVIPPSAAPKTFHIFNDCNWTVTNGGCCLEWTVPTHTSQIKFELVGGGGPGGSSGGDHDGGIGGQGGGYAVKTISNTAGGAGWVQPPDVMISGGGGSSFAATVAVSQGKLTDFNITNGGTGYTSTPEVCFRGSTSHPVTCANCNSYSWGQSGKVEATIVAGVITDMVMIPDFVSTAGNESTYLLCAGGSSECSCCCSCNMNCKHGCTSYATGSGLQNFCAIGGQGGHTNWDIFSNCYNCQIHASCCVGNYNAGWVSDLCHDQFWGSDYGMQGSQGGWFKAYDCCQYQFSWAGSPRGPFSSGGLDAMSNMACSGGPTCCSAHSTFPGGGGAGRVVNSSTGCVGGWGAGGLIKITYQ